MRCHGAYKRWRQSINVEHGADKEVAAYEEMLAAVELTSLFDDAHVIVFPAPGSSMV